MTKRELARIAAVEFGRMGGRQKSEAKAAAARKNGQKGGWPKGKKRSEPSWPDIARAEVKRMKRGIPSDFPGEPIPAKGKKRKGKDITPSTGDVVTIGREWFRAGGKSQVDDVVATRLIPMSPREIAAYKKANTRPRKGKKGKR